MKKEYKSPLFWDYGLKKKNNAIGIGKDIWNPFKETDEGKTDVKKIIEIYKERKCDCIVSENVPNWMLKDLLTAKIPVLTCHTMTTRDRREEMGIPHDKSFRNEGHKDDVLVIMTNWNIDNSVFYPKYPNKHREAYSNFLQVQKTRIQLQLRSWSLEAESNITPTVKSAMDTEKVAEKEMHNLAKSNLPYGLYLSELPYIGPRTAGGIIGYLDVTRFPTASSARRYAGLSVINGEIQKLQSGKTAGYVTELKSLLLAKIADGFIKSKSSPGNIALGRKESPYLADYNIERLRLDKKIVDVPLDNPDRIVGDIIAEDVVGEKTFSKGDRIYKNQKNKNVSHLVSILKEQGRTSVKMKISEGHAHAMAKRKMMSKFLEDYWCIGRQFEGFPTSEPYIIAIGGHSDYRPPYLIPEHLKPFKPSREVGWIFTEGRRPMEDAHPYIRNKLHQLGYIDDAQYKKLIDEDTRIWFM